MGAREEIARLTGVAFDVGAWNVRVLTTTTFLHRIPGSGGPWGARATVAEAISEAAGFVEFGYGVDESSALAALLDLVRLRARMRRDEIDAALAAGGV